ncbi:MAG: XrtB/PEP-CTERM-associated polysaccharide biosynthesis outer membrane protein EpsL [Thiogranum sp.]
MINLADSPSGRLFVFLALLSPAGSSFAVIEKFTPYAYVRVVNDSNVFRLSGDEAARALLGSSSRNDTIGYVGGGFETDLKLSRQHLLLDAEVERAEYDSFGELDHTRTKGRAAWAWRVGNLWNGEIGTRYNRRLRSFYQSNIPEKDMRTEKAGYLSAGYQLHPDWRLSAGVDVSDVSYQERDRLDRDSAAGNFQVLYNNTRNTKVGVRVKYTDNDLRDDNINGVSVSNDYSETEISGLFFWEVTGKSDLEANLGYTDQNYDDLDERDFQGTTGRLTYNWYMTGKTELEFSAWRETSSYNQEITTYVLTKGASIGPVWSITPKITLTGLVSYYNDDFKGENDIRTALGGQRRDDDTWLYSIDVRWTPRDYMALTAGYRREDRDSSIDANDFDDSQYNVGVRLQF